MPRSNNSPSHLRWKQRYRERLERARQVPLPDQLTAVVSNPDQFAALGRRAAVWVKAYRYEHGQGPTWRELGDAIHPDCEHTCTDGHVDPAMVRRAHTAELVAQLKRARWLYANPQPRSLKPGSNVNRTDVKSAARQIVQHRRAASSVPQ